MENTGTLNLTICPDGFVTPDDPTDRGNDMVRNSTCAIACISPVYTESTWAMQAEMIKYVSWIGIVALSILLVTTYWDGKSLNRFVLCTVYYSGLLAATFIWMGFYSPERKFCRDNSVVLTQDDGLTPCIIEAAICIYTGLGIVYTWYVFNLSICK